MNRLAAIILLLMCAVMHTYADTRVYVLDIDREIDATTWLYTRKACREAVDDGSDIMVVHLNTYGGELQAADSIRTALMRLPLPTVAFVDHNAASAGALIALACDSVYMAPGSSMGAATVVDGSGVPLPDKYQSYMRSIMRSTAMHHGRVDGKWRRDPAVAEAMVDPRVSVPGLVDSTKVVTFTPDEAVEWGFADGQAASLDGVLSDLGINHYTITRFEPTLTDRLLGFLGSTAVQAVLIMLIIGGIYFELHSPGLGFPSAVALVSAVLYFLPMYAAGSLPGWVIILFIAGVVLIALELFVIPGFGVTGISGIAAIVIALGAALVHQSAPVGVDLSGVLHAVMIVGAGILGAIAVIWLLLSRFGPKFLRRTTALELEQKVEDGYIGVDTSLARLVGSHGTAVTPLRPSGKVEIDGETYDAVSTAVFIEEGTPVEIVRFAGAQLYVRPME